jgi:hypothetical protein
MAIVEQVKAKSEEYNRRIAKIEKENPLIVINLGDLVMEMHKLYALDPNVLKPRKEIPKTSINNYRQYHAIVKELNRRESNYQHNRYQGIL